MRGLECFGGGGMGEVRAMWEVGVVESSAICMYDAVRVRVVCARLEDKLLKLE